MRVSKRESEREREGEPQFDRESLMADLLTFFKFLEPFKRFFGGRRTQDQTKFSEIPDEIIFYILSKLPIRSVVQCRCVCKSWFAIIADPQFAYSHLAHSAASIILWYRTHALNTMYSIEPDTFQVSNLISWVPNFTEIGEDLRVVGSCNGLICMSQYSNHDRVYICNPLTRQSIVLPPPSNLRSSLGFGFASNTREYKVVKILLIPENLHDDLDYISEVEVYTLGTGYWRSKGTIPHHLGFNNYFNTFLNGALHWISIRNLADMSNDVILSFDIGDEEFREIQLPEFGPITVHRYYTLVGVIDGSLSIHNYSSRKCVDIWIMKDYGVKESWSKYFVFPEPRPSFYPLDIPKKERRIIGYCPAWISGQSGEKLVAYDEGSRRLTDLKLGGVLNFNIVFPHVASLITLEYACGGEKMSRWEKMNIKD